MINVVFNDSTCGCLKMAAYLAAKNNNPICDLSENLFIINLCLDEGDISDNALSRMRLDFLNEKYKNDFFGEENDIGKIFFESSMLALEKIKTLLEEGESIRIWYSNCAFEFCGFCWLISILDSWGIENDKIKYVHLPGSIHFKNGEYKIYENSSSFEYWELVEEVSYQRNLSDTFRKYHIEEWNKAKKENGELRIIISGGIVSVREDIFDFLIDLKINEMDTEFYENAVAREMIKSTGELRAHIIEKRIEKMINEGKLEIAKELEKGKWFLDKYLRKK